MKFATVLALGWVLGLPLSLAQPAGSTSAGTNSTPAQAPASAPVAVPVTNAVALENGARAAMGDEVIPIVTFEDAIFTNVISFLGEQAGLDIQFEPPASSLGVRLPDGAIQPYANVTLVMTNVTARDLIRHLLRPYQLVLKEQPGTNTALISLETPVDLGQVAAPPAGPEELPVEEIPLPPMPLEEALKFLGDAAQLVILFDPKLFMGTTNVLGTNVMDLPAMKFTKTTHRQALDALLMNHDLMRTQLTNNIWRVTRKPPPGEEPLFSAVIQLRYAAVTNMVTLIAPMLTTNRSKVSADTRTSQLVLLATQRELESVTNLVEKLDTPTKQVLIEARLIETSRNPRSIKGIDWSGTLEAQNVTFGNGFTTGTTDTRIPGNTTSTTLPSGRSVTRTDPISSATALSTVLGNGGFSLDTVRGIYPSTGFLNADGVRAVLSFINRDADSEVVATPRAVMLDNQKATLSVIRAFPIFKITPGTQQQPAGSEVNYTNVGTILEVTPRIAANSNVSLHVVPEVSNIDSKDRQVIAGQINEANVFAYRKIETYVTIPSGNTLVMGGLISDSLSKSYTKVPILGDLPVIGFPFRHQNKDRKKVNLIIFLTPTILRDEDFQPTPTDFLQTKPVDKPDIEESAWESGKPHQWTKPAK